MTASARMAKLIQICASQNDLFGLDGDGIVYHYNFNTNSWMRLGRGRPGDDGSAGAGEQPTIAPPDIEAHRSRLEIDPPPRGNRPEPAR
jgi:hypothetical protein